MSKLITFMDLHGSHVQYQLHCENINTFNQYIAVSLDSTIIYIFVWEYVWHIWLCQHK